MSDDNHEKVMEKLSEIHTDVAVLKVKVEDLPAIKKRVNFHDKVVGAVVLASGILITLIKYGKL